MTKYKEDRLNEEVKEWLGFTWRDLPGWLALPVMIVWALTSNLFLQIGTFIIVTILMAISLFMYFTKPNKIISPQSELLKRILGSLGIAFIFVLMLVRILLTAIYQYSLFDF